MPILRQSISAYAIDPSIGVLTSVPGSPYPTAGCPVSITVDQSGQFVYAGETCTSNDILGYRIDTLNGALTPLAGSPFPDGGAPLSIAVSRTIP